MWTTYGSAYRRSDNKLFDYYSNTTSYVIGGNAQGASYKKEGDAYNREHSIPQSWWGGGTSKGTQGADPFIVVPTDGYVNNRRSNYPFGMVNSTTYTSNNNFCKLGSAVTSWGYTGTVFEPDDSLKGDFARIYFYAIAKYSNSYNWTQGEGSSSFSGSASTNYGLTNYAVKLFSYWSNLDPVSEWEMSVNNNLASIQGNRNPFIDHPEYANTLWGSNSNYTTYSHSGSTPSGSVTISKSTASITAGGSTTISATSSDGSTISWSSNNTSVATVSANSANSGTAITINALAAGTATITAGATIDEHNYSATCTVTVTSSGGGGGDSGETTYTLVTSNNSLSNGDKVVVKTAAGIGVTGNGSGNAAVSETESQWKQFVVGSATSSGFTLYDSAASQYIESPSGNTFGYSTTAGTCSVDSSGHLMCNNRYLCKNGTYYRFYTSIGSFLPFFVYLVNDGGSSSPTVSSIQITNAPTKLTYTAGECFDPTGLLIKATYSDNSKVTVEYALHSSDFSFTPSLTTPLTTSNTSVSISYGGASASQAITVNAAPTLSSISLSGTYPTVFTVGDTFSHEGMVVTANYTNPTSSSDVTSSASWSSPDMSSAGNKTVTVTYSTASTTYQITVNEAETPISGDYIGTKVSATFSTIYSNQQKPLSLVLYTDSQSSSQKITALFDKGTNSNSPAYYDNGSALRFYPGNTLTITSSLKSLVGIKLSFGTGDYSNPITANIGTYSNGTWTGGIGGDYNSVVFTIGGSSNNRRISAIDVNYFSVVDYPSSFLSNITCDNGVTRPNTSKWSSMSTNYGYLFAADKKTMKDTSANQSGTTIQKAVARYDYIVGKYNKGQGLTSYNDFMDRDPATISGSGVFNMNVENNSSILIVVISALSLFTLGAAFIYKKKRKITR